MGIKEKRSEIQKGLAREEIILLQRPSIAKSSINAGFLGERVILISNISKKELFALFIAFDINALMLLDMEVSQKICKVVPYTNASVNKHFYDIESDSSISRSSLNDSFQPSEHKESSQKHAYQSLFYNLTSRDKN